MTRTKNRIFIIIIIIAIIVINLFVFYARFWANRGYAETKEEDLQKTFVAKFAEKEYQGISHAKKDSVIVYLGKSGGGGVGNYAVFRKSFLFDRWGMITSGILEQGNHPMLLDEPLMGRIYLSLNARNIVKAEITKDGETTEIDIDPDNPLIVITEHDIDSITFFSESGKEISEEDFLNSEF